MQQTTLSGSYPEFESLLGQLSRWPSDPLRGIVSPKGINFIQFECWQYPGTSDTVLRHCTTSDGALLAWLGEQPPKRHGLDPSNGLKVLIGENLEHSALSDPAVDPSIRANANIERERHILQEAVAAFGLSDSTLNLFGLDLNAPPTYEMTPQAGRGKTVFLDFPYHRIAWVYDETTCCTSALFISDVKSLQLRDHLVFGVDKYQQLIDIPMLLGYLSCFMAVHQLGSMLDENFDDIKIIELQTGHNRRNERMNLRPGRLPQLSSIASGLAAAGTARRMDIKRVYACTEYLLHVMEDNCHSTLPNRAPCHEKLMHLISSIKSLQKVAKAQEFYAEELKQRAIVQQTALFQLLAQKDQQSGLQIASDSRVVALETRKDGSSMKTIAVMTLMFLPPTFIAVSSSSLLQKISLVYLNFSVVSPRLYLQCLSLIGTHRKL